MESKNLIGQRFNKLTVISLSNRTTKKRIYWDCICDCGKTKSVRGDSLKDGSILSCGCQRIIANKTTKAKHYHTVLIDGKKVDSRAYRIWSAMKQRCYAPASDRYKDYGGRGIKICERWRNSFVNFLEDMGYPPDGYSIERIDVDGDYEPSNCKWAKNSEQARNKQSTIMLTYEGVTKPLITWAEEKGLKYMTVYCRHLKGWTPEEILSDLKRKSGLNQTELP